MATAASNVSVSGPANLQLKRKATDEPLDILILESHSSKTATESPAHYVRRLKAATTCSIKEGVQLDPKSDDQARAKDLRKDLKEERHARARRCFHLHRSPKSIAGNKRGAGDSVATFVEKRARSKDIQEEAGDEVQFQLALPSESLKRPSKGAAVKVAANRTSKPESDADRRRYEALADYMQEVALRDIANEPLAQQESRPRRLRAPRPSGQKSRDVHRQRAATNSSVNVSQGTEIEDETEYVFDTYVLATPTDFAIQVDSHNSAANVGYLVITEEDQSTWEAYLESDPNDQDGNSDEEDENAEDYYGADYPEDELASDDEFDRSAYGFRKNDRASDDDEWDEDTGAFSDDDAYERMMEPFTHHKTLPQFAKYLDAPEDDNER